MYFRDDYDMDKVYVTFPQDWTNDPVRAIQTGVRITRVIKSI